MIRIAEHPLVPNGESHKNRREAMLAANVIRQWHVALRFCRERKDLSIHQLADRIGASAPEVLRWEAGEGAPSGSQLPRLYGTLPQLQAFKEYLPKLAVKTATMVEVARARSNKPALEAAAKPVPPPAPKPAPPLPAPAPVPPAVAPPVAQAPGFTAKSFGAAVRAARAARGWDQKQAAQRLNVAQSTLSKVENDGPTVPNIYLAIVTGLPELRNPGVPVPAMVRRRTGVPWALPPAPQQPTPPVEEPKALPALPAGESLAVRYAAALDAAGLATIEAEQAQARFVELDDKAKAARATAEDLLRQLHERAGWKG